MECETGRDWALFRLEDCSADNRFQPVAWRDAMEVAAWMRHATAKALRNEPDWSPERIAAYIQGHNAESCGDQVSYLPLPSIGMQHADGRIRRVAIVEPQGRATGVLPLLQRKLEREVLRREKPSGPVCRLARTTDRDRVARRYQAKAQVWMSATPVILHGFNASRGRLSVAKTERLLVQAFEQAGFPARLIRAMTFQATPLWAGTGTVFGIRVPRHLDNYPRYHVSVEFHQAVGGPVLAGIGRHYGLGLFAAAWDSWEAAGG